MPDVILSTRHFVIRTRNFILCTRYCQLHKHHFVRCTYHFALCTLPTHNFVLCTLFARHFVRCTRTCMLVTWIRTRFLDTEVDGSNPLPHHCVVTLSKILCPYCFSRRLMSNRLQHPHEGYLFRAMSLPEEIALKNHISLRMYKLISILLRHLV